MLDLLYWTMVAMLFTHELDAVRAEEWRVLPLTGFLPETIGQPVFVLAHVPLFALVLLVSDTTPGATGRLVVAAFCVVHVGLHWLYRRHPRYRFRGPVSNGLIALPGVAGAVYLVLATGTP